MTQQPPATIWRPDDDVGVWSKLQTSPVIWGVVATAIFYGLIPYSPVWQTEVTRYFAGHWIEYLTTGLSFVALAILAKKMLRLSPENRALRWREWTRIDRPSLEAAEVTAFKLEARLRAAPAELRSSVLGRRLQDTIAFVIGRRSASALDGHLQYLAKLAAGDLHSSYALVRTITWGVPILGFLGTVVGITMAIASLTPEQFESSLSQVTQGLGTAFDTTALSLGWSMVLVFGTFAIERFEQRILGEVEALGTRQIAALFPQAPPLGSSLAVAEAQAAEQLLQRTEAIVNWQVSLWQQSLEALRQRWAKTMELQQTQLEQTLQTALSSSLAQHDQQLVDARSQFLLGIQQVTSELHHAAEASRQSQECHMQTFGQTVREWQSDLLGLLTATQSLTGEIQQQGQILLKITEQEEALRRLEGNLAENLQVVRESGTFEETLHTLNAAVHLLTNRVPSRAA